MSEGESSSQADQDNCGAPLLALLRSSFHQRSSSPRRSLSPSRPCSLAPLPEAALSALHSAVTNKTLQLQVTCRHTHSDRLAPKRSSDILNRYQTLFVCPYIIQWSQESIIEFSRLFQSWPRCFFFFFLFFLQPHHYGPLWHLPILPYVLSITVHTSLMSFTALLHFITYSKFFIHLFTPPLGTSKVTVDPVIIIHHNRKHK